MNSSERNLMDTQPTKNATVTSLPDELIVRMAHEAGWLEAEGKIKFGAWEDLQIAIRDAINEYYDNSIEKNPFDIEDILDSILLERFSSEQEKSQKSSLTTQIQTADAKKAEPAAQQSKLPDRSI